MGPGWLGVIAVVSAVVDDLRQLRRAGAAEPQADARLLVDRPRRLHAGRRGGGERLARGSAEAAGSVLFYLVVYAFANVGAFAVAAWLARDKKTDDIDDLNGLGFQYPVLATCILVLMLSLIGIPPFAGFFGKLYMFMEALEREPAQTPADPDLAGGAGAVQLVVSAFYYVRVLKAMFLRHASPGSDRAGRRRPSRSRSCWRQRSFSASASSPSPLLEPMKAAAVPMLAASGRTLAVGQPPGNAAPDRENAPATSNRTTDRDSASDQAGEGGTNHPSRADARPAPKP